VREYLIAQGVPSDEIDASGRGELEPKYPNDGEENRRIGSSNALFGQSAG